MLRRVASFPTVRFIQLSSFAVHEIEVEVSGPRSQTLARRSGHIVVNFPSLQSDSLLYAAK